LSSRFSESGCPESEGPRYQVSESLPELIPLIRKYTNITSQIPL